MTRWILKVLLVTIFASTASLKLYAAEMRRIHKFVRPTAMGDAFTAVADSKETIGYNPAGLLQEGIEWTLSIPVLGMAFDEEIKNQMKGESELDFGDLNTLSKLPGKRLYTDIRSPFLPMLYIPEKGIYTGFDANAWLEITFPPQTIIPTVGIEIIGQGVYEYAMAFELFGFNVGANMKLIQRQGVVADVDLVTASVYLENNDYQKLIDEYADEQPEKKLVLDLGMLYRFDHPWNPRIGISSLDMISVDAGGEFEVTYGGVDYKDAGEVTQLNSIGFAFTRAYMNIDFTGSIDFHDYTFSYFSNDTYARRISIGFEAAYGRRPDNSHLVSAQLGLKELKYPSFGLMYTLGPLEFGTVQWVENYGTKDTEITDTRYMFLISLVI